MQSSPRYLIIPDRGRKDILALLSLSSKTLRTITNTLRSQDALKAEERSYQLIAREADITNESALAVLNAIMNLTIQRKRYALSDAQLLQDLQAIVPEEYKKLDDETKESLFLSYLSLMNQI